MQTPIIFWVLLMFLFFLCSPWTWAYSIEKSCCKPQGIPYLDFCLDFLALIFNAIIYFWRGPQQALEFFTGYLIEKALSVDNIFVFIMIFTYFHIPSKYQHRVLFGESWEPWYFV